MTGQELKRLYMSLGWTGKKTAQELGIDPVTLSIIIKREEVDKRTEYAMRWLEHQSMYNHKDEIRP